LVLVFLTFLTVFFYEVKKTVKKVKKTKTSKKKCQKKKKLKKKKTQYMHNILKKLKKIHDSLAFMIYKFFIVCITFSILGFLLSDKSRINFLNAWVELYYLFGIKNISIFFYFIFLSNNI
jgi:hypothetical protein